jgi:WD40 repeat protein
MISIPRSFCAVLLILSLPLALRAQREQDLEDLLRQLKNTPAETWEAYLKSLTAQAQEQEKRAQARREEAARMLKDAEDLERRAKSLHETVERRRALRALVDKDAFPEKQSSKPTTPAATPAAEKPADQAAPVPEAKPAPKPATPSTPAKPPDSPPPASGGTAAPVLPGATSTMPEAPLGTLAAMPKPRGPAPVSFDEHIAPIFSEHCTRCHGPDSQKADLDLSSLASTLIGGGSGRVVIPGDSSRSRLYRLMSHAEAPAMPLGSEKLPQEVLETVRKWIDVGLESPSDVASPSAKTQVVPRPSDNPALLTPPVPQIERRAIAVTPGSPVRAMAFSPRAPLLATNGGAGILLFPDGADQPAWSLDFPLGEVESLRFSRDGEHLLVTGGVRGRRGAAVVYHVRTAKEHSRISGLGREILTGDLSPLLSRMILGGPEKIPEMIAIPDSRPLFSIEGHQDWILSSAISQDGNYVATGDRSGVAVVSEADTGRQLHVLREHTSAINALRFRHDAGQFATASDDGTVRLWTPEENQSVKSINTGHGRVLALEYGPDYLATGGSDGRVRLWDSRGNALPTVIRLKDWVNALAISSDGSQIAVATADAALTICDRATGKPIPPRRPGT